MKGLFQAAPGERDWQQRDESGETYGAAGAAARFPGRFSDHLSHAFLSAWLRDRRRAGDATQI
ncbi:hypothetical protein GCM10028833_00540 [Glycomyces tarimensis]